MPFGLRTRVSLGSHVFDGGPDPPWEWTILREERGVPLWSIVTLCGHLCENGWTDIAAVWIVGSEWPNHELDRVQMTHEKRQFWGKGWLNRLICRLGCGLGWTEGSTSSVIFSRWRKCAHMGGHIGATWRVWLNRPSAAAMWSYVKLLWPLISLRHSTMSLCLVAYNNLQ